MLAKNISFKQRPFLCVWVSVCVYTSKTHTRWTPVIPFQHMLWIWPVSRGALPYDWKPRQPQTIKQSKCWIALKHWRLLHCDMGSVEINHIGADFLCKLAPWSQSFSSSWLECREHISDLSERNLKFSPVSLTFSLCAKSFHGASGCFRVVVHRVTLFNTFRWINSVQALFSLLAAGELVIRDIDTQAGLHRLNMLICSMKAGINSRHSIEVVFWSPDFAVEIRSSFTLFSVKLLLQNYGIFSAS